MASLASCGMLVLSRALKVGFLLWTSQDPVVFQVVTPFKALRPVSHALGNSNVHPITPHQRLSPLPKVPANNIDAQGILERTHVCDGLSSEPKVLSRSFWLATAPTPKPSPKNGTCDCMIPSIRIPCVTAQGWGQ